MAIPNKIKLTGKVSIKYIDGIESPQMGDIMLLLNDDAINPIAGDYENTKNSGYIKAKIFDNLVWQNIDIAEFCTEKENKFAKKQKAIDSALLCKEIIERKAGTVVNRTYRGHFTVREYIPTPYVRRASNGRR
jgi:hypothetical protein